MAKEQSVHELETVVAQRDAAMARARNLEVAIRHAVETSERLHPTAECCVEWQQEIEALRSAGGRDAGGFEMKLIYELKTAAQVTEGQPCRVRKSALLDAIRALRALEEIANTPVGTNWPAEATRMRELARDAVLSTH